MHALLSHVIVVKAGDHPLWTILAFGASALVAGFTGWLAYQTRALAAATQGDVAAQFRPIVVVGGDVDPTKAWVEVKAGGALGMLSVRLINAGRGPALNVRVTARSSSSVPDTQESKVELGTLAPGVNAWAKFVDLLYRDSSGRRESLLEYEVIASYNDVARTAHKTMMRFADPERGSRVSATEDVSFLVGLTHTAVCDPTPPIDQMPRRRRLRRKKKTKSPSPMPTT